MDDRRRGLPRYRTRLTGRLATPLLSAGRPMPSLDLRSLGSRAFRPARLKARPAWLVLDPPRPGTSAAEESGGSARDAPCRHPATRRSGLEGRAIRAVSTPPP